MGVEVKGAGDGVVIADRGCNDCNYGRNNSGWGSGWGAVGGALEVKSDLALQLERCCCDLKNGQQEIKCLIENTAKDQEIARLNLVVDAQRDQNIISQVVAALKGTTTTPA